ncbi:hypothetical protein BpHYR1_049862 [Brachionus plicatilis]|uniref:Uncharacterized protein n=1 Tax=Brachionus plicatilis TaxID=10195 RepID=A0A3M7SUB4_BRAPC|nr:hypothetical protein BpHYR1_049862 [Brachionus plicatilis]
MISEFCFTSLFCLIRMLAKQLVSLQTYLVEESLLYNEFNQKNFVIAFISTKRTIDSLFDFWDISEKHEFFAVLGSYCCGQIFLLPFQR